MEAERTKIVNGHKIEEFYWNGKMVVYVNNRASSLSFDDAVEKVEAWSEIGAALGFTQPTNQKGNQADEENTNSQRT